MRMLAFEHCFEKLWNANLRVLFGAIRCLSLYAELLYEGTYFIFKMAVKLESSVVQSDYLCSKSRLGSCLEIPAAKCLGISILSETEHKK
jgi:hypothetical protein